MRSVYKSKPAVFIHADKHFSAQIVKEKMRTVDIRGKGVLNTLKILVEGKTWE